MIPDFRKNLHGALKSRVKIRFSGSFCWYFCWYREANVHGAFPLFRTRELSRWLARTMARVPSPSSDGGLDFGSLNCIRARYDRSFQRQTGFRTKKATALPRGSEVCLGPQSGPRFAKSRGQDIVSTEDDIKSRTDQESEPNSTKSCRRQLQSPIEINDLPLNCKSRSNPFDCYKLSQNSDRAQQSCQYRQPPAANDHHQKLPPAPLDTVVP